MRAAFIESTGGPEVIQVGELATPSPGPGQVLVQVAAATLNPIDLYIRSGMIALARPIPYIIGCDLAGTVVGLGPGAARFQMGDRVWASNQGLQGRQGGTSEFAAVDEVWLHRTPKAFSDQQAAAWSLVGITAHLGLFACGEIKAGEAAFITGGSGGVGTMAIQMAKAAGARVACTAGTEEKAALCRSLGADFVINYRSEDISTRLREFSPDGVDLWFETQREPNLEVTVPLLRARGRLILIAGRAARPILPVGPLYTRNASIHGFAMFNFSAEEQSNACEDMVRWGEAGALRSVIAKSFPLAEAAAAHQFLEQSTLGGAGQVAGKVIIDV